MYDVSVVEAETLANGNIAIGVFKCDSGWGMQNARTGAQIQRGIQLIPLGLVVSPQRERITVLLGSQALLTRSSG